MGKPISKLQKTHWQDVRDSVIAVNPSLAKLIDNLDPSKDFSIYKASYPFGSSVLDNGNILIPDKNGNVVSLQHNNIDNSIKEDLAYSPIPLGLWLNTNAEVFANIDNRIIPLHVFTPGSAFGLWEILDLPHTPFVKRVWSIAAGSRTLFMLPKITDAVSHDRLLKACKLRGLPPPKTLFDQYKIFAEITKSPIGDPSWHSEVLFFSRKWFEEERLDDIHWLNLRYYLLKNAWSESLYWRNKVTFRLIEQTFANAQETKNLKAHPLLIDTVMHLISVGICSSPAFAPLTSNCSGPLTAIQNAYTEFYGLKSYIPTLMAPQYLREEPANSSVYYSLQLPTVLGSAPKPKSQHSLVDDQRILKLLLEALKNKLETDDTPLFALIKNLDFDFFHLEADSHNGIRPTVEMIKDDLNLICYSDMKSSQVFCETSSFLRGCIRISKKQNQAPTTACTEARSSP